MSTEITPAEYLASGKWATMDMHIQVEAVDGKLVVTMPEQVDERTEAVRWVSEEEVAWLNTLPRQERKRWMERWV